MEVQTELIKGGTSQADSQKDKAESEQSVLSAIRFFPKRFIQDALAGQYSSMWKRDAHGEVS